MSGKSSRDPFQLRGRYASRSKWENLAGPGDSRPTAVDIIEDESLLNAWPSRVVLITGVSSGMGVSTLRALAATGATIFGTARDLSKARSTIGADLLATGHVHLLHVDQSDLSSVRTCAAEFRTQNKSGRLDILICNAAVMNTPEERTKDGFETQFGVNYLSHFLLFNLLRDQMVAASTSDHASRVISVSSMGHRYAPFNLADPNFAAPGSYNGWAAYGASKTAIIHFISQVDRLYKEQGIRAFAVHPGGFESPNLQKHSSAEMQAAMQSPLFKAYMSSLEQAAATSVYGAVSAELEGKGGLYLEGASHAALMCPEDVSPADLEYGFAKWAFDEGKEKELWEKSKEWTGVQ